MLYVLAVAGQSGCPVGLVWFGAVVGCRLVGVFVGGVETWVGPSFHFVFVSWRLCAFTVCCRGPYCFVVIYTLLSGLGRKLLFLCYSFGARSRPIAPPEFLHG